MFFKKRRILVIKELMYKMGVWLHKAILVDYKILLKITIKYILINGYITNTNNNYKYIHDILHSYLMI